MTEEEVLRAVETEKGRETVLRPVREDSPSNEIQELLDKAVSMKELGLYEEAIGAYAGLLGLEYPPAKVIPDLVTCLSQRHSPDDAVRRIQGLVDDPGLGDKKRLQIQILFALELERRGNKTLAIPFYEAVANAYPENRQIKEKLLSLKSSLTSASRYDHLLDKEEVTAEQLQQALAMSKKRRRSVEFILVDHFKVSKEDVGKSLSMFFGCPFKGYDPTLPVPVELIRGLKKSFLLHDLWVPLRWGKDGVEVLVDDPKDLRKTGQIEGLLKTRRVLFSVGIKEDIEQYIIRFFDRKAERSAEEMLEALDLIPDIEFQEDEEQPIEEEEGGLDEHSSQVMRLVDQVIITAFRRNASDIHVEPSPITNKITLRFRLDGVCQEYLQVPNTMARGILSRLKIMAGLDIAERRLPQDGKIKFRRKDVPSFELRMATLPTTGGHEDAVLRILSRAGAMTLDQMGLNARNLSILKQIIAQPYGLVLVAGPTGSGKTTTLHACVGYINNPGIKIWTAEDPVEITQAGLRQVEVKPKIGLDFARVMRSFLRADPDVIMIGEMRDFETASIGIEASLTGHMVFSTLHTNSAPETVTRLLDMGLNPLNFSDALLGVLAQRLVRKVCTQCRKAYHPSREEFDELVHEYGEAAFPSTAISYTDDLVIYRPHGCEVCSQTGYRGRMGIHEMMEGSPTIKRLIKKQGTSEDLFHEAAREGMTTLKQDGILKVFQGLTDIKEIRRVCIS